MAQIIAIDPGTVKSGYVILNGKHVVSGAVMPNKELRSYLMTVCCDLDRCVIEMIASQGMAVGIETFETCVWIGRFMEVFGDARCDRIYRRDVKLYLCGSSRAKDPNVWQAVLDRYGATKALAVGKKKSPGPLFGVTSHQRQALAVGVCWLEGLRSEGL